MHKIELSASAQERFVSKIEFGNGCWVWRGSTTRGYGRIKVAGVNLLAHRVSWSLSGGELPDDAVIDHICFNKLCVNPSHLRTLSREDNARRHPPTCNCNACVPVARATACPQGHELSGDNLVASKNYRRCRACQRAQNRAYMRRVRAAA